MTQTDPSQEPVDVLPVLTVPVRVALVGVVAGLVALFAVALKLNPYQDGRVWRMETHTQLGLMRCTFQATTGQPCPSCGMSTSFALLVRGDVANALRANSVGTALATFCLLLIPWGLVSVARRQPLFILSIERTVIRLLIAFVWLMLVRWATVLALHWWNGTW